VLLGERIRLAFTGLAPMLTTPLVALPSIPAACAAIALSMATVSCAAALGGMRFARMPALPLLTAAITAGACAAMLAVVTACVLAWSVSMLNFWLLGIATVGWQYWRHGRL
jgi:hypothetical protein